MTAFSLFYNHAACGDILLLVGDELVIPDRVEAHGDVVVLKRGAEIVGINILNSLEYVKIHAKGLIHATPTLAKLISDLVEDYAGYQIEIADEIFILGQVVTAQQDGYLIEIGQAAPVFARALGGALTSGEYVEVAVDDTRLKNGHRAFFYLEGRAEYLVTDRGLPPASCGTRLYQLKGGQKDDRD